MLADVGSHVIIIEVDEQQHIAYGRDDEKERHLQLLADIGSRPLVLIRFNPDAYIDKFNQRITSCWGVDKCGQARIAPSKAAEWATRLMILRDTVHHWLHQIPIQQIEHIELFFNVFQLN